VQARMPYNLYDFFGYLFPGMAFILFVLLFFLISYPEQTKVVIKGLENLPGFPWWAGIILLFAVSIFIYCVGHIIATISSFVFDKTLVRGTTGYPYLTLLRLRDRSPEVLRRTSAATYKVMFLFGNLCLLAGSFSSSSRPIMRKAFIVFALCFGTVVVLRLIYKVIGSVISSLSTRLSERMPYAFPRLRRILWLPVFWFLCVFFDPFTKIVVSVFGIRQPFPKPFVRRYKEIFYESFGIKMEEAGTENYWLSYCYVANKMPDLGARITVWLHLYAFARNLATACYLAATVLILLYHLKEPSGTFLGVPGGFLLSMQSLLLILIAWIMLIRYYYLYAMYFTKFIFRSFVACRHEETQSWVNHTGEPEKLLGRMTRVVTSWRTSVSTGSTRFTARSRLSRRRRRRNTSVVAGAR